MVKRKIGKVAGQLLLVAGIIASVAIAYSLNQRGGVEFTLLGTEFEIGQINYLAAVLTGAIVGWSTGQLLDNIIRGRRWRRWVAMVTLIVFVLVMTLLFGRNVFVVALISVILTILFTIAIQRELYGGGIKTTATHHFRLSTGSMRGFQVIDDGKTVVPANAGQLMGPLMLVIRSGNAAVTVNGSSLNVYGPGVGNMIEFEYVKKIYQLGEHRRSFEIENVFTKERILINAEVSINYSIGIPYDRAFGEVESTNDDHKTKKKPSDEDKKAILTPSQCVMEWFESTDDVKTATLRLFQCVKASMRPKDEEKTTTKKLSDDDKKAILTLYQSVKDWKAATIDIVEQSLRDLVNSMDFDDFDRPENQESLAKDTMKKANEIMEAKDWPIIVHQMVIKNIQPDKRIAEAISKAWAQEKDAEARAEVLNAMARAYQQTRKLGMTQRERRDLVLKAVVDHLASDPTTSIMFNEEINEMMAMLRK